MRWTIGIPLQLLVSTILSAQCTDVRVNLVTPCTIREVSDCSRLCQRATP